MEGWHRRLEELHLDVGFLLDLLTREGSGQ
jgi:hypothetical protein